jgi:hypothetical protein
MVSTDSARAQEGARSGAALTVLCRLECRNRIPARGSMIRALTLAGALAVIMACESPEVSGAVTIAAGADPAAEVVDASKAIITAFGRNDPDAYFKLFDPEATFIFYTTPQRLESRSAYEQEWAAWRRNLGFRVLSCQFMSIFPPDHRGWRRDGYDTRELPQRVRISIAGCRAKRR